MRSCRLDGLTDSRGLEISTIVQSGRPHTIDPKKKYIAWTLVWRCLANKLLRISKILARLSRKHSTVSCVGALASIRVPSNGLPSCRVKSLDAEDDPGVDCPSSAGASRSCLTNHPGLRWPRPPPVVIVARNLTYDSVGTEGRKQGIVAAVRAQSDTLAVLSPGLPL